MEYAQDYMNMTQSANTCNDICDDNYYRYVGYKENNDCIQQYFSKETVDTISLKVTELTRGVDPNNRAIIVPRNRICDVMSQIYYGFRPPTAAIYSRYTIPTGEPDNYMQMMIDQVIEVIVSDIRNNLGMEECNRSLSVWTTVLGDFNTHGLSGHDQIKVRNKRPSHSGMVSFLNY
jgi:hypothetical protein